MLYAAEAGDITLALTGDIMMSRRIATGIEPGLLAARDVLRGADAAFANLESTVRLPDEGTPGITVGTHTSTPPDLLDDIKWAGVSIVSAANNHAYDFGELGLSATMKHLRAARLPFAGIGSNLAEARAPAYFDSPRGRVGVVATTATYRPWNRAGSQGPDMLGRPGVNPYGVETVYGVDDRAFEELRRVGQALGFEKAVARDKAHFYSDKDLGLGKGKDEISIAGIKYRRTAAFSIGTTADEDDRAGNLSAIREARRQADWVIASFHSHEVSGANQMQAGSRADFNEPAEFMVEFAHAAIDAGADVVAGHGSHTVLGIEIYKARPIFYGLGNFVFMNETVATFPADAYRRFGLPWDATPADFLDARTNGGKKGHPAHAEYWQGMIGQCRFRGGTLDSVTIVPIDLGHGRARAQRGRPCVATGAVANAICARAQLLSRAYGTDVVIGDGTAEIRLG